VPSLWRRQKGLLQGAVVVAPAEGTLIVSELDHGDGRVGLPEEGRVGHGDIRGLERPLPALAGRPLQDLADRGQLLGDRRLSLFECLDLLL
jgi:hypothetical protein